jgi:hypothetical protein
MQLTEIIGIATVPTLMHQTLQAATVPVFEALPGGQLKLVCKPENWTSRAGAIQVVDDMDFPILERSHFSGYQYMHAKAAVNAVTPSMCTVVIPCHNYAIFLGECLTSVFASTVVPSRVVVIDDSSTDTPRTVADEFKNVEFSRVEFRDVHRVRAHALETIRTKYVLFLDADNRISPDYLRSAMSRMEADRNAAFVFPVLTAFGDSSGSHYDTQTAPDVIHRQDIEQRNYCDCGSVIRTDALKQSAVMQLPLTGPSHDWAMFRRILRAGPWHALKATEPFYYRVHADQMSVVDRRGDYFHDANLACETVTIVIAFSGRWNTWVHLRAWLTSQEWPQSQLRLLIMDSSHECPKLADFGLEGWTGSIAIERMPAGRKRLADEDRKACTTVREDVETAVSAIYNQAVQLSSGEFLLFVEDDVIPHRPDAIRQLLTRFAADIVAVSGLYQHRYEPFAVAFLGTTVGTLTTMEGPDLQEVTGSGFGCLLIRRSVLSHYALSGDQAERPHYDVDLAHRISGRWLLDRTVHCDHLVKTSR